MRVINYDHYDLWRYLGPYYRFISRDSSPMSLLVNSICANCIIVLGFHMGKKRHSHFKSCISPTWPFIKKTVESDVNVL